MSKSEGTASGAVNARDTLIDESRLIHENLGRGAKVLGFLLTWESLLFLLFLVIMAVNSVLSPVFLDPGNLLDASFNFMEKAIIAMPMIFVIVCGDTGSGKTTQIPKMCLEAGLGIEAKVGCTQPRRVAALSISRRIAEELNVNWGREVGCKIRFDDRSSQQTEH